MTGTAVTRLPGSGLWTAWTEVSSEAVRIVVGALRLRSLIPLRETSNSNLKVSSAGATLPFIFFNFLRLSPSLCLSLLLPASCAPFRSLSLSLYQTLSLSICLSLSPFLLPLLLAQSSSPVFFLFLFLSVSFSVPLSLSLSLSLSPLVCEDCGWSLKV